MSTTPATPERHSFQADVQQVLSLVVNSLYTHKEVFLRELVSNASDALDQLAFRALTDPSLATDVKDLGVSIVPDTEARTLTVSDDGIGMTHDELVKHLGTIAHSGTKRLIESLSGDQGKDLRLIGRFGVGFYSAFLVAERVAVVSRAAGAAEAWRWESSADGAFTVEPAERSGHGTDVVLFMKKGEDDFVRDWTLRDLVRRYSDFVRYPIRLRVKRTTEGGKEPVVAWEQVNSSDALWMRAKGEITDEQYVAFYKHLTHDWEPPLAWIHFKVEGVQDLTGLFFVPRQSPMELMTPRKDGVRLFVRRVFVMDECEELVPTWLRFLRGVLDSDDLPLNVSREFLQKDRGTNLIRKQVVRHALEMLESLAAEDETTIRDSEGKESRVRRYEVFWRSFGRILKEALHLEHPHRERIAKLLRFESSNGPGLTSLPEYVTRMKPGQEAIYHVAADTRAAAQGSPHIEALRRRGWEVLYLTDPADEWTLEALPQFEGKKIVSAAKGALLLADEPETMEKRKEAEGEFAPLVARLKEVLGARVSDVRVSTRLADSPVCLVSETGGMSPHIERLMRANRVELPETRRVLEVNPEHGIIRRLRELAADPSQAQKVADYAELLFDQALVAEGSPPSDPARFARQVAKLLEEAARS